MIRLALYVLLLVAAFGAAAALGRAVGPFERAGAGGEEAAHGEEMEDGEAALPGLAIADRGYRLELESGTIGVGGGELAFAIVGEDGERVSDGYDVLHERPMHVIVVRRDLERFVHLHPRLDAAGSWRAQARLGGGVYRVFADFSVDGERVVLGADLFVEGPEGDDAPRETEYAVTLAPVRGGARAGEEVPLVFSVTRDGRPVTVEPYLGARGHLVVLRQGDLAYVHAHAEEKRLVFETELPSPGRYRLFLQYQADGVVRTADFHLRVVR